jgi:hypothetical protein
MSNSYIPNTDANALAFMQTFSAGISANPAVYQLASSDAAAISAAVNNFASKYAIAVNPATRTPGNIAAKTDAKKSAIALIRQYAIDIKYNAGIPDEKKIDIGVRPVNASRTPINVPQSSPLLNIVGATPGSHTVRFADSTDPERRARPFGAANLQLFVAVGTAPTTDEGDGRLYGCYTKGPIAVAFDSDEDGKVATYFARWASAKGEFGPWSLPVSMRIAA